jgi:hypothetical protein
MRQRRRLEQFYLRLAVVPHRLEGPLLRKVRHLAPLKRALERLQTALERENLHWGSRLRAEDRQMTAWAVVRRRQRQGSATPTTKPAFDRPAAWAERHHRELRVTLLLRRSQLWRRRLVALALPARAYPWTGEPENHRILVQYLEYHHQMLLLLEMSLSRRCSHLSQSALVFHGFSNSKADHRELFYLPR